MYLLLDSIDNQNADQNNADVRIDFNDRVLVDSKTPVILESFEIPNSMYNVTSKNNKLELDSAAVSLDPGSYILTDLMTHIDTKLTASNGHDFTVSYSDTTGFMNITSATGNFEIDFNVTDSCATLLGYYTSTSYSGAATYTASKIPVMTDKIYIHIDEFTSPYMASDGKNPSFVVDNDQSRHMVVFYKRQTDNGQRCDCKQNFKSLNIRLKDKNGNLLENCPNWQMILNVGY